MTTVDSFKLIAAIQAEIGHPYQWGGAGPDTFDCSGLIVFLYSKFGVALPHKASLQQSLCTDTTSPQLGDLVFYGRPAHHVGLYIGTGRMVNAPDVGKPVQYADVGTPTNYGHIPGVTVKADIGSGLDVGTAFNNVVDAATGGWIDYVKSFISALMNPNTWLRIGETTLGIILIAVGTARLTHAFPAATRISHAVGAHHSTEKSSA